MRFCWSISWQSQDFLASRKSKPQHGNLAGPSNWSKQLFCDFMSVSSAVENDRIAY